MTPAAAIPFDRAHAAAACVPLPAVPKTVSGGKGPQPCGMAPALPAGASPPVPKREACRAWDSAAPEHRA